MGKGRINRGGKMKILVACEESQRVCEAFRKKGHEAYSCDIVDPSGGHPEWHIKSDALHILGGGSQHSDYGWHRTQHPGTLGHDNCVPTMYASGSQRSEMVPGKAA